MTSTHVDLVEPIDLVCDDLAAGVAFFRDVLGLPVSAPEPGCRQVHLGGALTARLWPTVPGGPGWRMRSGAAVILEVEVADLQAAVGEVRRRGGQVLIEPVVTEWGTDSAFIAGPDAVIVELYQRRDR
jgi:catechol 2,3-dioxygenase-like lactoylglutathione lyase family enzyme